VAVMLVLGWLLAVVELRWMVVRQGLCGWLRMALQSCARMLCCHGMCGLLCSAACSMWLVQQRLSLFLAHWRACC
jgi:hypothetical protein